MHDTGRISAIFTEVFGAEPAAVCFAPGRVNLIGEHTDYNGGHVFPCALELGISCAARIRDDDTVRMYSASFPDAGVIEASLDNLGGDGRWADYTKAVFNAFISHGYDFPRGADLAYFGDLPDGAGLSSSAAIEVLTATVFRELYGYAVTPQQAALMGQFAENRFIGLNCGIMDQFASAMGRRDHAIYLDTDTLRYAYAPIPRELVSIVLIDSGVKHSLASSAYNDRRRECSAALAALNTVMKARSLCAVSPADFERHSEAIADPVCRRRARHAVYEEDRTARALEALRAGDVEAFGALMTASHISLRDDYEVSCRELDLLVDEALTCSGVYGARMTGGGFGGCTVNLVRKADTDAFTEHMREYYQRTFSREARIFVVEAGDGARAISEA